MYTEYWGLRKPPFDNVPDPTMYVEAHLSVENTVAETLFAIEEGKECDVKGKIELLEVFNKLLFSTADEGKKVLIFIDEANAISPANLESLRLLTNMQDDS